METRELGRTGHESTLAIFGSAAFWDVTQWTADQTMAQVMAAGVNHIDVAPSYGKAEIRLRPWLEEYRDRFFLGCKTAERSKEDAARELRESLERLGVDHFDLYQLHAVDSMEQLDRTTGPGGALEAIVEARQEGLLSSIGITGHGLQVAGVFHEALERFEFDTVMFPINFVMYNNPAYRASCERLLQRCRERKVGVMVIKAVARALWHDRPRTHSCWYEPFDQMEEIQQGVDFSLSQPGVTALCTSGDVKVLPLFLRACQNHQPLTEEQQTALVATAGQYEPIFSEAHPTL